MPPSTALTWRRRRATAALAAVVCLTAVGLTLYGLARHQATQRADEPIRVDLTDCDLSEPFPTTAAAQVHWALCHHRPTMILFYSNDCRPCRMMDALVQMVKPDYVSAVTFIDVPYDDPANAGLLRWARVGAIPVALFVTSAGEVNRVVGQMDQLHLRAELARIAATTSEKQ